MNRQSVRLALAAALLMLSGCEIGSGGYDIPPQRGIDADINASRDHGPTSAYPGIPSGASPVGVRPWEIGQPH